MSGLNCRKYVKPTHLSGYTKEGDNLSAWKSSWKLFRKELKELYKLDSVIFSLVLMTVSGVTSYFTGYGYIDVVAFLMILFILLAIGSIGVLWLKDKLNKRKHLLGGVQNETR